MKTNLYLKESGDFIGFSWIFRNLEVLTLGGWNPQTKFLKKWMP